MGSGALLAKIDVQSAVTCAPRGQTSSRYTMERKCLHRHMPPLWPAISTKVI